ncbi:hypothetical protein [Bacillus cereus]|uniref:hypothetical protein n=1 Tax=Bacillus cereus TaxID=1396 RepID=UPI001BA5B095|nr:hypothetical protein [Bacillus cereus]MEB9966479.1 hypothetical protein [Bacillus cereus]
MSLIVDNTWLNYHEACDLLGLKLEGKRNEAIEKMNELFKCEEYDMYSKLKIENFLGEHISVMNVILHIRNLVDKNLGMLHGAPNSFFINKPLKSLALNVIKFSRFFESKFISNDDFEKMKQYYKKIYNHPDSQICLKKDFINELQLGNEGFTKKIDKIFDEYGIKPYIKFNRVSFYKKEYLDFLKNEQQKKLQLIKKSYMTVAEATEMYGFEQWNFNRYLRINGLNNHLTRVPHICAIQNASNALVRLIPKQIINNYVNLLEEREAIETILSNSDFKPYQCYQELLDYFCVKFSEEEFTERYWFSFVRIKLEETRRSGVALREFILMMFSITKMVVAITSGREILGFTSKEINLSFLNNNIPNVWQRQLYNFFNRLNDSCKEKGVKIFDMNLIENPKYKVKNQKEKEVYSVKDFISLIDFCKEPLHKSKAIIDAEFQVSGNGFKSYSSMWLYTIIHMNNAWRHSDVIKFPRLTIPQYNHLTLEWLINNEITPKDAEVIADFYRSNVYTHSKNDQKRFFIISDELLIPFANAVLICELIQREVYPLSDRIIEFQHEKGYPSNGTRMKFFESFESESEDFEFKSSIMNNTVISLATDVISKLTNSSPIEAVKFFRNHSDVEITNIYINIPEKYVNYISSQLFNLGNFGYIYDNLSLLLFGEDNDREKRSRNAFIIKKTFGSIEKIESIAHCAQEVASEREHVKEFISTLSPKERLEKYGLLNLGLSPSKTIDLQCLVGLDNCPMGVRDCDKCPLMIPNRFTLCSLNLRINEKIKQFVKIYENTNFEGEKVKVANQLYISFDLVKQAINKFGRDTVSHFINIDEINETMKNLPSFKQHISLIAREEVIQ